MSDNASGQAPQATASAPATGGALRPGAETVAPPKKRGRRAVWWILGVLAVAILAVVGYFAYEALTAREAAEADLERAITLVERADSTVLDVDDIVRAEIDAELGVRAAEQREKLTDARDDLDAAIDLVEGAIPDLDEDGAAQAQALKASAEARIEMLLPADTILEANVQAANSLDPAREGWDLVLEGEGVADKAVEEYNKLTDEAVTESKKLSEQAVSAIEEGKALLEDAADAFPDADITPFVEYATTKLANLALAIQADDAFLGDKNEDANKLSTQFNEAETKLVEQAKSLPSSPAAAIAEGYESVAGTATTEYFDARERATQADAELNILMAQ